MKLGSPSFQLTIRRSTPEICQRCLFLRGLLMLKKPPSFASAPLDTRDLPKVPVLARPADAKETAIVCFSAALLFV